MTKNYKALIPALALAGALATSAQGQVHLRGEGLYKHSESDSKVSGAGEIQANIPHSEYFNTSIYGRGGKNHVSGDINFGARNPYLGRISLGAGFTGHSEVQSPHVRGEAEVYLGTLDRRIIENGYIDGVVRGIFGQEQINIRDGVEHAIDTKNYEALLQLTTDRLLGAIGYGVRENPHETIKGIRIYGAWQATDSLMLDVGYDFGSQELRAGVRLSIGKGTPQLQRLGLGYSERQMAPLLYSPRNGLDDRRNGSPSPETGVTGSPGSGRPVATPDPDPDDSGVTGSSGSGRSVATPGGN